MTASAATTAIATPPASLRCIRSMLANHYPFAYPAFRTRRSGGGQPKLLAYHAARAARLAHPVFRQAFAT